MTDTKHAGTPPKLTQSFLDPYCAVDQAGKPVLEMLHSFEPGIAGEYLRSIIEAFNSHAALAEDNAQLRKALASVEGLFSDGSPFYIAKVGNRITNGDQDVIDKAFMLAKAALEQK